MYACIIATKSRSSASRRSFVLDGHGGRRAGAGPLSEKPVAYLSQLLSSIPSLAHLVGNVHAAMLPVGCTMAVGSVLFSVVVGVNLPLEDFDPQACL